MKILLVVPEYGKDSVGAAAIHSQAAAETLSRDHTVEIATTTAVSALRPAHYAPGVQEEGGLRVHRFALTRSDVHGEPTLSAPGLLEFLHGEGRGYGLVIFYECEAASTALGLPIVPERAALIPMLGAAAALDARPFRTLFQMPRAIGFLSEAERAQVNGEFHVEHIPYEALPAPSREDGTPTDEFAEPLERLAALAIS